MRDQHTELVNPNGAVIDGNHVWKRGCLVNNGGLILLALNGNFGLSLS